MRISVIVTTYNNPDYLRKVLDGFTLQTRLPDELIVADDGSGPETSECIGDFSSNATFPVRHIWHEDKGFRAARIRNEAVKASTGDYVVFLDGDCLVNRHFIADHLRLARKGHFVQGKRVIVRQAPSAHFSERDTNRFFSLIGLAFRGGISNSHHILRMPLLPARASTGHRGIKTCNMGVFRDDILAVNGFNERFLGWGREDSEFAVRLYRYGLRRLDHPFMAICFHLWHRENDRTGLEDNDRMLQEAMQADGYRCTDGIEKA